MLHRKLRRVTSTEKTNRFKEKFEKDLIKKVTFGQRYERVMRYLGWRDLQAERKACAKGLRWAYTWVFKERQGKWYEQSRQEREGERREVRLVKQ